jgi:hypothetical protein
MDVSRLSAELGAQRRWCEGRSPLYASVLRELEADAAAGAPWTQSCVDAWGGRPFPAGWEAAHLLLAAMHYWALSGRAPELGALYPSCGGRGGDPNGAASAFLARAPEAFWNRVGYGYVQTNEVDRSVAWMVGAAAAFGGVDMPYHLVELGASGGLNLIGDHVPHECRFVTPEGGPAEGPPRWDSRPHPVLTRTGLDISPRRLTEEADRLWVKACVWADDLPRLERLDAAVAALLRLDAGGDGPRLERCSFLDSPAWLERALPAHAREGLVVFNSIATVYLSDPDYAELRSRMEPVLASWGRRGLWVEFERSRGAAAEGLELRLHQAVGGTLATRRYGVGPPRPVELRLEPRA